MELIKATKGIMRLIGLVIIDFNYKKEQDAVH